MKHCSSIVKNYDVSLEINDLAVKKADGLVGGCSVKTDSRAFRLVKPTWITDIKNPP